MLHKPCMRWGEAPASMLVESTNDLASFVLRVILRPTCTRNYPSLPEKIDRERFSCRDVESGGQTVLDTLERLSQGIGSDVLRINTLNEAFHDPPGERKRATCVVFNHYLSP